MSGREPSLAPPVWVACLVAVVALGCSGCGAGSGAATGGGGGSGASDPSPQALRAAAHQRDGDGDNDSLGMTRLDLDHDAAPTFGQPAGAGEHQAIVALFDHYYADAASEDVAGVCSLLDPIAVEDLAEADGGGNGPQSRQVADCRRVVGKLLAREHRKLAAKRSSLKVGIVQVRAKRALVVLDFGSVDQQVALVHDEGGVWMLTSLFEEAQ